MNILKFPDEKLRVKSKPIEKIDAELTDFIKNLKNFMYENKGCVGIAAPQVAMHKRIIIVDASFHKKTTECNGLLIMLNPQIIEFSGESINREGCLSVPDFTGNVKRSFFIKAKFTDINGEEKIIQTSGFEAVVIQHEIDHLDGILFIDRITNLKRDLFKRKNY
jgi:peptide deformylase